jgi:hypothetical protein
VTAHRIIGRAALGVTCLAGIARLGQTLLELTGVL